MFTQVPTPLPLHKPWPALVAIAYKVDKVERDREINFSSFMAAKESSLFISLTSAQKYILADSELSEKSDGFVKIHPKV